MEDITFDNLNTTKEQIVGDYKCTISETKIYKRIDIEYLSIGTPSSKYGLITQIMHPKVILYLPEDLFLDPSKRLTLVIRRLRVVDECLQFYEFELYENDNLVLKRKPIAFSSTYCQVNKYEDEVRAAPEVRAMPNNNACFNPIITPEGKMVCPECRSIEGGTRRIIIHTYKCSLKGQYPCKKGGTRRKSHKKNFRKKHTKKYTKTRF
jgi:hypothetical protein